MKTKEEIISFLKRKHVLNRVYKYTEDQRDRGVDFCVDPDEIINWGFCWEDTPEGHDFWRHIDQEYRGWYVS